MKQAYQHLEKGTTHYQFINDQITGLVKKWNMTHTKQTDPKIIGEAFKTIFKYHHWISVDDIEPVIDLGFMGEFGENKGLNNETIFSWFKENSKRTRANEIKNHSAYKTENTFIPDWQRKETRLQLIETFMKFYNEYIETKTYNPDIKPFVPVFFRWFKKLGYIELDEQVEQDMFDYESKALRNMRTIFSKKPDSKNSTVKDLFKDAFIVAANNNYPIEDQLKSLEL